jgi:hemolysin activation/secretion protein
MTQLAAVTLIATAVLVVTFADVALAAKFTDQEHTRIDEPRPAGVPSDAELEAAGATIGKIEIDTRDIFDQSDPRENSGLFELADHLHIRTKHATIRAQLLFASGDRYVARRLAETERNLRLLPYLYDARVVPVRYADGKVDIKVVTKDVWTLSPGVSVGRTGGTNSSSVNIQDTNFLGWGKTIQFVHSRSVDRTSDGVAWTDPNVFGSRWTSALAYINSSDGEQRTLQIMRPFYSLDTQGGANVLASTYNRTVSRYSLGEIVDQFNDDERSYELSGGVSSGLQNGWATRWLFGMRYDRNLFVPTPNTSMPASPLPPDRTLSYPFVGFDLLRDNYKKAADLNQIGRTEDLYFGPEISGEVGYSNTAFGADRQAIMLASKGRGGFELNATQYLFLTETFSSRVEGGHFRNLIETGVASYYWRWRPDWLLYSTLSATNTDALDPDTQLLIGGDNGLRGYPLRYESGTSRALWSIEQRFYTDWYPFRLVRVGGAIFSDIGRTWGHGVVGNSDPGLLKDVGFGLRLGNTRSGLGNVLHIDLAFPLAHLEGINNVQFLVQAQQSF